MITLSRFHAPSGASSASQIVSGGGLPRRASTRFAVGEVSDRAAVARPEGRRRAGGHVEADRLQGIE